MESQPTHLTQFFLDRLYGAENQFRARTLVCMPSSVCLVIIVIRRTAKMTAVDRPNNSMPFIAVIGPRESLLNRRHVPV
jgi:hypothetical protein